MISEFAWLLKFMCRLAFWFWVYVPFIFKTPICPAPPGITIPLSFVRFLAIVPFPPMIPPFLANTSPLARVPDIVARPPLIAYRLLLALVSPDIRI